MSIFWLYGHEYKCLFQVNKMYKYSLSGLTCGKPIKIGCLPMLCILSIHGRISSVELYVLHSAVHLKKYFNNFHISVCN